MKNWKEIFHKIALGVAIVGFLIMGYAFLNYAPHIFGNDMNSSQEIVTSKTNDKDNNVAQQESDQGISDKNKPTTHKVNREVNPVTIEPKLLYPERPKTGENIGTLEIPTIDALLPIIHGTDEDELEKGVGHYSGSVLPGEPDHSLLSGHRDTVFRNLKDVQIHDSLIVTTLAGTFTYEVVDIYIVDQYDRSVITPTSNATLSLTTCYPFAFVGNAPKRYIIHSVLVDYELAN
jgi:sortase A